MTVINIPTNGQAVIDSRLSTLEAKYVRSTRFESIGAGTSGSVTLPTNSTVVLDDFGGTVDAVVTTISGGRPTFTNALDSSGNIIATTFGASGAWVLSGTPASYPVAIVYRVRQTLLDFDGTEASIVGEFSIESLLNVDASTANATFYIPFVAGTSGSYPVKVSSSALRFNPSSGALIAARFYIGLSAGQSTVHIDQGAATKVAYKCTAGATTGQGAADGTDWGLDASGNAEVRQYENLAFNIYTNNVKRAAFSGAGEFTQLFAQGSIVTTVMATTLLNTTHNIVLCNLATAMAINLPAASTATNRIYRIKNINIGVVTITGNSAELIDAANTYLLSTQYTSVDICCNGAGWFVL